MFQGEFEGMSAINQTMPDFSPKPIAWGRCKDTADLFFFLSTFVEMTEGDLPDPKEFCANLAKMHRESVSPTGQFGFHVTTCNGNIPQNNTWNPSWEVFFSDGLRHMLALDLKANGEQPELVEAMQPIFDHVIPRLLRPLEQGPNRIRPALVHGDLWFGNCSTNLDTDEPVIFDAAAFYAHNEYELGNWRPVRNLLKSVHLGVYKTFNPPSHPAAEFEDRIMLYELRFNFHFCIMVSGLKDIKKE
ncbi:Fructosamine/Ketosamine-3-kinase [Akanthomyces lecanii RCEF 1005]|uniref:protein-ribulosamine 3-kinase n=1 Tax=Akanthomyces lecanii RCEF 1005 TaxID=1081108 RepID=A0A168GG84_CORDF|nr:Fructosamine/Ketosamine-3-kinase [Akanthomyces lecanii RCEF 1005]